MRTQLTPGDVHKESTDDDDICNGNNCFRRQQPYCTVTLPLLYRNTIESSNNMILLASRHLRRKKELQRHQWRIKNILMGLKLGDYGQRSPSGD